MLWAGGPDTKGVPARATRHYALAVVQCALSHVQDLKFGFTENRQCVWLDNLAQLAHDLSGRAGRLYAVDESDFTAAADGLWYTSLHSKVPASIAGGHHRVPDLFLELQRLAGADVRLLVFKSQERLPPPPPDFWLDFGQRHFLDAEGLTALGHGVIGTVYDVPSTGQVLKETRCGVGDLVPGQGIFWHQTRFASSRFARSASGVVPLLRYGFRRASTVVNLLAESLVDGAYSRYKQDWEHRGKSLLVMQTLWPKAKGEPLWRMLQSPAAAAGLPQVLIRLERVICDMHAAGYAHNDLHAGNILVQGPHEVTVIDYDLVRPANADSTFLDYLSIAHLTFDADFRQILAKFFPKGGARTKLASADLQQLPRLRHYVHVGRWEALAGLDLLLFPREHLQLLGLDPTVVSYDVEYHVPPHVTIALLASTTDPRAFRAVLLSASSSVTASATSLRVPPSLTRTRPAAGTVRPGRLWRTSPACTAYF